MVDVCVDSSFDRDESGILTVRRCGNGTPAPWPFPSDPALTNGLRRDETCGLWVAPAKEVLRVGAAHNNAPNASVSGNGLVNGAPLIANVTNPSATLSMLLVLGFHLEWRLGMVADSFAAFRFGWSRDNPTVATREISSWFRPAGIIGGVAGWIGTHDETITDILTPGQSATYRIQPIMASIVGTNTYLTSSERIDGFGITL